MREPEKSGCEGGAGEDTKMRKFVIFARSRCVCVGVVRAHTSLKDFYFEIFFFFGNVIQKIIIIFVFIIFVCVP